MTDSSLVNTVNSWFYNPGSPATPEKDRMWCYIASVVLIAEFLRGSPSRAVTRNIHDLLTYTLLGWNPITAWVKRSDYTKVLDESEIIVGRYEMKVAIEDLLDFTKLDHRSASYALMTLASKTFNKFSKQPTSSYTGEYVTMIMLALWLLDRKLKTPLDDLVAIRACMDLFYRSRSTMLDDIDVEYAKADSALKYGQWMNHQIDRLLVEHVSADRMAWQISYFAWFGSLVRAERMIKAMNRNVDWSKEVTDILENEVAWMKNALDAAELKVQRRNIPKPSWGARLAGLLRSHPPKVKIKQMTKEK